MNSLNARLVAHLRGGGTVLTANRRQARILRRLHDEVRAAAGEACWPTPKVLPLDAWAATAWQALAWQDASLPLILAESQAAWVWRRHGEAHLAQGLVSIPELASAARRSWLQLRRHGGSLAALEAVPLTRDQGQFLAWARAVEADLGRSGWLDPGLVVEALAARAGDLPDAGGLLLTGFDPLPPVVAALLAALGRCGWECAVAAPDAPYGDTRLYAAPDPADETAAMLAWLRARLEADPAARLAVIVTDLQARRGAIERGLEAMLQPELELPGATARDRLFDLAGGEPLERLGIAGIALDCLEATREVVDFASLSRLLRSRYMLPGEDAGQRARLDVALRRSGVDRWPLAALVRRLHGLGADGIAAVMAAAREAVGTGPLRRPADEWASRFGQALAAWGWPGSGALASDEFQAAGALRERLGELAGLARTATLLSAGEALAEFRRLVAAPFQAERGAPAVWLLDALEPPGIGFDGLWVSGMTATAWPRAAEHDPFLPLAVQVGLGMAGVTAEGCLRNALDVVEAWRRSAGEVIFSWPLRQDDAQVEPSRVLPEGLPRFEPATVVPATRTERQYGSTALEAPGEDAAPALAAAARGGARVLELQAKCPFRAFAELRLGARPLEEPQAGVDPRIRGLVLHRALEIFWNGIAGYDELAALSPGGIAGRVEEAVAQAFARELPEPPSAGAAALEREWQRLAVTRLVDLDRGRDRFEVVATESDLVAVLSGLQLRLRVDRIDRVAQGLVVIDYKTGRAAPSQWRGARPDAPQLTLYATHHPEPVAGVALAVVGAHEARYRGVGVEAGMLPGLDAAERFRLTEDREHGFSWDEVKSRWRGWLDALARDYRDGVATVDPKRPQTCQSCHLATLCRVAPELEDSAALEEDGDD